MKFIVLLLALFFFAETSEVGNGNAFVDRLLCELTESFIENGADPLVMGEVEECNDCVIFGLSNMTRNGDAVVLESDDGRRIYMNISFPDVFAHCSCSHKVSIFGKARGELSATIKDLISEVIILENATAPSGSNNKTLESFYINYTDMEISFKGTGFLGRMTQTFFGLFRRQVRGKIIQSMTLIMGNTINEILSGTRKVQADPSNEFWF